MAAGSGCAVSAAVTPGLKVGPDPVPGHYVGWGRDAGAVNPCAIVLPHQMDKKLLDIVCCPLTKLPLQLLDATRLARLNSAIETGGIPARSESPVGEKII